MEHPPGVPGCRKKYGKLSADEMERIRGLDKEERFFVAFEGVSFEQAEANVLSRNLPD